MHNRRKRNTQQRKGTDWRDGMQESKNMPQKNLRKCDKRERAHNRGNHTGERGEALESTKQHARDKKYMRGGEGPHARQRERAREREGMCTTEGKHKESKEKCLGENGTVCETGVERKVPGMMWGSTQERETAHNLEGKKT